MTTRKFLYVGADGQAVESAGAYETSDFVSTSAGAGDAGKPIVLNGSGLLDGSFIDASGIDHGGLAGLGDDDHTQYILVDGTRAFTGDQSMGSNKITNMAPGTAGTDAVNKDQLDAVEAGQEQKESCRVATTTTLPAYTAAGSGVGKTLTANANGSINSPGIDGITDLVVGERVLVKNENGGQGSEGADVDHGIYEITQLGDGSNPFILTRASDFDGDPSGEVTKGARSFIQEGTENGATGWQVITDDPITVDTTTIQFDQFQGLPQYTASLGVQLVGIDFRADLLASGGLKLTGNEIGVEPADFAGAGLVDDGADNMAIDWSTAFNDAKAVKAEDLNSTVNGEGASIIGVEDVGGFFTATDVEGVLQEIYPQLIGNGVDYTTDTGGVSIGDLVYISANDTVAPYSNLSQSHRGIGLALTSQSVGQTVKVARNDVIISGVLSGASAGTPYYWDGTNITNTIPSGSGSYVWQVGVSRNATDLATEVRFIKKNA